MSRDFLMLAKKYEWDRSPVGWWASEKLDGERAWWDGGWSQGKRAGDVPWANVERGGAAALATGLWTRYAKVIQAPDWWLDGLPGCSLDGELWLGRGRFQELRTIVAGNQARSNPGWKDVKLMAFDSPDPWLVTAPGEVRLNGGQKMQIAHSPFTAQLNSSVVRFAGSLSSFPLSRFGFPATSSIPVQQVKIKSEEGLRIHLDAVLGIGGEGLMLRADGSIWEPKRSSNLLKVKKLEDTEATVVGWTEGKGRLEGMVGALVVKLLPPFKGRMELAGLSDAERQVGFFKIGETVTMTYSGLTDAGLPRNARYFRRRDE